MSTEESMEIATSIFNSCQTSSPPECYGSELRLVTKKYGLANAEAVLYSLQDRDDFAKNCHIIAHYMAHEAYLRKTSDFTKLFDWVNINSCAGGFLHGVIEAYTGSHPKMAEDGEYATEICKEGKNISRQRMCIHFMGHIFIVNSLGNINESMQMCAQIKKEWMYDCYEGLFMEYHQKLMLHDHGISDLPPKTDEYVESLEKACNSHEGIVARACWTQMAEIFAHTYGYDSDIIYKKCYGAKNYSIAESCYQKGVTALAVHYSFNNDKDLGKLCSYYRTNPRAYKDCVYAATSAFMYYSPKFITRGTIFCNTILKEYEPFCFDNLLFFLKSLIPSSYERKDYCSFIPKNYRDKCVGELSLE